MTLVDGGADYAHARWFVTGFPEGVVTISLVLKASSDFSSALEVRPAGATMWIRGETLLTAGENFSCEHSARGADAVITCQLAATADIRELDIAFLPASGFEPGANDPAATGAVTLKHLSIEVR